MEKKDWLNIWLLLKETYKTDRKRIISMVALAMMEVVQVYVEILLLGTIVDLLTKNYTKKEFISYVVLAFSVKYVCVIIQKTAQKYYDTKLDYTKDIENFYMNEKAMVFDYEFLEDSSIADLRYRSFGKSYYGITGWCLITVKALLKGMFSIVITIIVVSPMVIRDFSLNDIIVPRVSSLLLLLLVFVFTFLDYKVGIYYTRKAKDEINKVENLYNRKQYYFEKFSDIEFQKDIRINNLMDTILLDVHRMFDKLRDVEYEYGKCYVKRERVGGALVGLNCVLIYLYVGIRTFKGLMTAGSAVIIASCILQFSNHMLKLASALGNIKSAALFAQDYLEFMNIQNMNRKWGEKKVKQIYTIEFENVSFKYPNEKEYALKNISLNLKTDETIAIVGKNGSGKTTLIKLLCGFYQNYEGIIRVDGKDIKEYSREDYWKKLSIVFQDFNIFDFSIRENFTEGSSDEEIYEALKKSGFEVENIDDKIGKNIYCEGRNYSGGEKQKIAIARAILKNAEVVIMDEPTAALDPVAENDIFTGFNNLIAGRGGVFISHRLSSCKFCNCIIVLNNGKIVQQGKHEQLLRDNGDYQELWNAQKECYQ